MPEAIKGLFFTDRLRGYVTTAAFLLIMIASFGGWLFPKEAKVDSTTIENLKEITAQMQRAADSFDQQSKNTYELNETLKAQLAVQEQNRSQSYGVLYNTYGLDPNNPPSDTMLFGPDAGAATGIGVLPQDDRFGSEYLPSGASATNRNQQLQVPATNGKEGIDGSTPGASGGGSTPARK